MDDGANTLGVGHLPAKLAERLEPIRRRLHLENNAVLPLAGADLPSGRPSFRDLIEDLVGLVSDSSLAGELREAIAQGRVIDVARLLEAEPSIGRARLTQRVAALYRRPGAGKPALFERIAALPVTQVATTAHHPYLRDALARRLIASGWSRSGSRTLRGGGGGRRRAGR
jgi:hypothetical protein